MMSSGGRTPRNACAWALGLLLACTADVAGAEGRLWDMLHLDGFWYLGGGAGYQRADAEVGRFSHVSNPCQTVACRTSVDDDSLSMELFGGYQFTPYVAAELAYSNLPNTYNVRLEDPRIPRPAFLSVDRDTKAVSLRGVFTLPMTKVSSHPLMVPVSLSGVLGLSRWTSETSFVSDQRGAGPPFGRVTETNTRNGYDLLLGARVNYDVNEQVRVSGSWERIMGVGRSDVAVPRTRPPFGVTSVKGAVDVFGVKVSYRFR